LDIPHTILSDPHSTCDARRMLEELTKNWPIVHADSVASVPGYTVIRHIRPACGLLLFDILFKDFRDLAGTLLRVSLLSALVVNVGDAESRRVALGPLKIVHETPG